LKKKANPAGSNLMLKKLLHRVEPWFKPGGNLETLYPLYEAGETFLYTPATVTEGKTHIRDALDTKRMMSVVIVALVPCIFMAMYNTGYQASRIIEAAYGNSTAPLPDQFLGWRYWILDVLNVHYREAGDFYQNFKHPLLLLRHVIHGALFFIPVYVVTVVFGGLAEAIFAVIRKHEINEGFLVTSMLFPLTLPPTIPLWQVAVGIVFGVVFGKEIFGGTGRNFLNPALTGRAFLYFAYAKDISGDACWSAVDGFSGATALGALHVVPPKSDVTQVIAGLTGRFNGMQIDVGGASWWDAFFGNMHGSMGETSVLACLIGAAILIWSRIGSWQIMAGMTLGMAALSGIFCLLPTEATLFDVTPMWHLVIGGFAFGTVFMATDPVSAAVTPQGKWIYGVLIGVVTVVVRCMNSGFAEGVMLAILFGNTMAPIIDYFVVQANIKRRLARS
jgi:Na+-transporting NADH:ubiquinone oxidoreductase subunit B